MNAEDPEIRFNPPADKSLLRAAVKQFPCFPNLLKETYSQSDGLKCKWYYESNDFALEANVNLSSLSFLLGGKTQQWDDRAFEDILWFEDKDEVVYINTVKKLKVLDQDSGLGLFILIDLTVENTPLYLWLDSSLYPLQLRINDYLEAVCITRGTPYWQFLFVEEPLVKNTKLLGQAYKNIDVLGISVKQLMSLNS